MFFFCKTNAYLLYDILPSAVFIYIRFYFEYAIEDNMVGENCTRQIIEYRYEGQF